jgi:hypothetical protein
LNPHYKEGISKGKEYIILSYAKLCPLNITKQMEHRKLSKPVQETSYNFTLFENKEKDFQPATPIFLLQ